MVSFFRSIVPIAMALSAGCTVRPTGEPIRIGHLAAFSGPDKARGDRARRGIELALREAAPELEVLTGRKVVVVHVDHQNDAGILQAEAVRLIAVNKVVALIGDCDAHWGEQLTRAAQVSGVPVVLTHDLPAPRAGAFGLGLEPAYRGLALARFARQDLTADRIAVVTAGRSNSPPGLASAFLRESSSVKGTTVYEWNWEKEAELPDLARRVADMKPKAITIVADPRRYRQVRQALDTVGLEVPLLYGGDDAGPEVFRDEPPPAGGLYLVTGFATEGLTEAGRDFARRFEESYNAPFDLDAAQGADAARFLFEAIRRSKQPGAGRFREELDKIDTFESMTGTLTFKERGPRRVGFVVEMKTGATRLLKTLPVVEE